MLMPTVDGLGAGRRASQPTTAVDGPDGLQTRDVTVGRSWLLGCHGRPHAWAGIEIMAMQSQRHASGQRHAVCELCRQPEL